MPDGLRLTAEQHDAALTRAEQTLALRSGAGCGKTLVLALRYAQLLRTRGDAAEALRRLVAITFTDKAAIEMQQRVRRQLTELAAGAEGDDLAKLRRWIAELPDARISTIHGFCASLLRRWAIEAGVDPDFGVWGERMHSDFVIDQAVEEAVLAAVEDGDENVAALIAQSSFDRVTEVAGQLVDARGQYPPADYADPAVTFERWQGLQKQIVQGFWQALACDRELQRIIEQLAAVECLDAADALAGMREQMLELTRSLLADPAAQTPDTLEAIAAISPGSRGSAKAWSCPPKDVRHRMKAVQERVKKLAPPAEDLGAADRASAEALATLATLAAAAIDRADATKRRYGMLDFEDLQIRAERLLADDPRVRRAVTEQVDQFLVDECQDTDPLQFRLIDHLTGCDRRRRPPEGSLFMVGDAKQSIYRFRGAEVRGFSDRCRRLGEQHNASLNVSFRTHRAGLAFVNELFAEMMGRDYDPIEAFRTELPPQPSVEILLGARASDAPIERTEQATAVQAAAVAQRIGEMLDGRQKLVWDREAEDWRPVRPGDVAVLFSRMTPSAEYERQLAAWDIPYYVVAGTGFFQQQEVFDVLSALGAVDNPCDDVAVAGMLRSGLIGLDDDAMMHIARQCPRPYFPNLRATESPGSLNHADAEALAAAVAILGDLHAVKDAVGIDTLIHRLLDATGYEATLLAQGRGPRPLGNVYMLIEHARGASAEGMALADFLAQADQLIINQQRHEQAAVAGAGDDVVRLMTIHKAKGLEFPVVIVPDLNTGRKPHAPSVIARADLGVTYRNKIDVEDDSDCAPGDPLSWRWAAAMESDDRWAEDTRRLYVAMTRHRDHLVLVGADWRKDGQFKGSASQLAEMDDKLGISAALDGPGVLDYGDGFQAVVRRVVSAAGGAPPGRGGPGWKMLAEAASQTDLADGIANCAVQTDPPELLGPLRPHVGRVELAVTALADFRRCPMRYRWAHELRIPDPDTGPTASDAPASARLDAATLGTLYHACMERLDFASPQAAEALIAEAAAEMELGEQVDFSPLAAELDKMLGLFAQTPLWQRIAGARQRLCELDFTLEAPPAVLRGQIDLLLEDADGKWLVVDYKSDRVSAAGAVEHGRGYALQMAAYAQAAGRLVDAPVTAAVLYFLRPAAVVEFSGEDLSAKDSVTGWVEQLLIARRSGTFTRRDDSVCATCRYGPLCHRTVRA